MSTICTSKKTAPMLGKEATQNNLVSQQGAITPSSDPKELELIRIQGLSNKLTNDTLTMPKVIDENGLITVDGKEAVPWRNWDPLPDVPEIR